MELGRNAKMYYSASNLTTPIGDSETSGATWVEIDTVGDVEVTPNYTTEPTTTRKNGGKDTEDKVSVLYTVSATIPEPNTEDTALGVLLDASRIDGSSVAMAFMNGAIATAGNRGYSANWNVKLTNKTEPVGGISTYSFEFTPADAPHEYTAS